MIPTSESELTALLQKLPFWEHLTAEENAPMDVPGEDISE